jgi:hypothetical protein
MVEPVTVGSRLGEKMSFYPASSVPKEFPCTISDDKLFELYPAMSDGCRTRLSPKTIPRGWSWYSVGDASHHLNCDEGGMSFSMFFDYEEDKRANVLVVQWDQGSGVKILGKASVPSDRISSWLQAQVNRVLAEQAVMDFEDEVGSEIRTFVFPQRRLK